MRWLAGSAVVVAIAAGVAISLLLSDDDEGGRGQVASAERAELLVRRALRLYNISIHDPPTALERAFLKRLLSGP